MIGEALSLTTKEIYSKVWVDLFTFMSVHLGTEPLVPVSPEVIVMYVVLKSDSGLCVQTIRQKLSAISYIHTLHRLPDPCKDDRVGKILKSLQRNEVPKDPKHPIMVGLFDCILEVVDTILADAYDAVMYRAVLSILYHACLRIGECVLADEKSDHALRWEQICFYRSIHEATPGAYSVVFCTFKHRNGHKVPPIRVDADRTRLCPVLLLKIYYDVRPQNCEYFFVHRDGSPVRASDVASVLHRALNRLGIESTNYLVHSLRAGKITDIVAQGEVYCFCQGCGKVEKCIGERVQ